jgi:Holliday junction resolvase RusA-like endonuclease
MKLVIKGNVPSKKNSKRIVTNRGTGKPMLISSQRQMDWHKEAIPEMKKQFQGFQVTEYPIGVTMIFFWGDLRRHDLDNGMATILDALKDAGIIEDDNFNFIDTVQAQYGGLDRENPRVEIYLDE